MTLLFLAQPSLALDTVASDDDSRTNDNVAHTNKQKQNRSLFFPLDQKFGLFHARAREKFLLICINAHIHKHTHTRGSLVLFVLNQAKFTFAGGRPKPLHTAQKINAEATAGDDDDDEGIPSQQQQQTSLRLSLTCARE